MLYIKKIISISMMLAHVSALPFSYIFQDNYHHSYAEQIKYAKERMHDYTIDCIELTSQKEPDSDQTIKRKGFIMKRKHALGTIVFCHGYTHSKHEAFFFKTFFPHFNAVAFDFRAHGDCTEGQYSTIGKYEKYEIRAAVQHVKQDPDLKDKPVIGFGFSMGAVALLEAQSTWQDLFNALILDTPFDSGYDCMSKGLDRLLSFKLFGREYRIPGKSWLLKGMYNPWLSPVMRYIFKLISGFDPYQVVTQFMHVAPIEHAERITIPCLFFACVKDTKVPVEAVKRLYDTIQSPFKRMWITHGIKHCSAYLTNPEKYWYIMNKFLKKVLHNEMKVPAKIIDDRMLISC